MSPKLSHSWSHINPIGMTTPFHHKSYLFWLLSSLLCAHAANDSSLIKNRLLILDQSPYDLWSDQSQLIFSDIELNDELGCSFRAASTNARLMPLFDLSNSTLNYVLPELLPFKSTCTGALAPCSMSKSLLNIYSCVHPNGQ